MFCCPRALQIAGTLVIIVAVSACSGARSAAPAIPAGLTGQARANAPEPAAATTSAPNASGVIAINAGGGAVGRFVADRDYVSAGTWTYKVANAIDTSGVTNPAPQAVYKDEREGSNITYTIPGLIAGAAYSVRLSFAELYWTAAGQRVFDVSINTTNVLKNFDIFATTHARYKAVAQTFTATASSGRSITIGLTASINYAAIDAVEISSRSTPPPNFNDYTTFGYDNARDVYNPNSTAITPASLPNLHLAWQSALGGGDYNTQSQPVLGAQIAGHAGILFTGGGSGNVYGYDALTGTLLWTAHTGQEIYSQCGGTAYFGVGGTAAYDAASKSLYVVGNSNPAPNAYAANVLYHLDAATGNIVGQVNFAPSAAGPSELNFSHTAVTLSNGIAYVGTGSTCDISSWRGRIVAVNVPSMTIANTFFTLWDPQNKRGLGAQPWGGGGIWGWGGVSLDPAGNVLTGVGNADNGSSNGQIAPPFVQAPHEYSGYGETLLELTANLSTVIAGNHPIPTNVYGPTANDLDVQGTPAVFHPNGTGCGTMAAIQGKSGELTIYDEKNLANGFAAQYQLSPSTYDDGYLGDPSYSPATGLVYAAVASSTPPTLFAPGLIAVDPGCGKPFVTWHAAFGTDSTGSGIPRSVPAASAGGVVFAGTVSGTGGDFWALNASTGSVLNGGNPLLHTSGNLRMPATIDGDWIFVLDNSGNMYGLTTDAHYPVIMPHARAVDARSRRHWNASPRG